VKRADQARALYEARCSLKEIQLYLGMRIHNLMRALKLPENRPDRINDAFKQWART
jgi:hypothetical protein